MTTSRFDRALIDGDILTYRLGFACEGESEGIVRARLDTFLSDLLIYDVDVDDFEGFLTAPTGNFRESIAVTAPYKGNRSGNKPQHYNYIREYLVKDWGFIMVEGQEADDAIGIEAMKPHQTPVICTIDKDLDNVPGWHFNFVKRVMYYVSREEATRNFFTQILTGDRIDNIIGIRGVGPVKASKILENCTSERMMYEACVEAYGDPERVLENGRLLWIRHKENEIWNPPELTKE